MNSVYRVCDLWVAFVRSSSNRMVEAVGFAFVTMASWQEAQAAVDKFDAYIS